jgi:uncharacterized membrane protein YcjF (UPF0283 family)
MNKAVDGINQGFESIGDNIQNPINNIGTFGDTVVAAAGALASFAMGIQMLKGLGDIWTNEDMSTAEKVLSTLTTVGMVLPMLISSYRSLTSI